jgi:hypothetical protein
MDRMAFHLAATNAILTNPSIPQYPERRALHQLLPAGLLAIIYNDGHDLRGWMPVAESPRGEKFNCGTNPECAGRHPTLRTPSDPRTGSERRNEL